MLARSLSAEPIYGEYHFEKGSYHLIEIKRLGYLLSLKYGDNVSEGDEMQRGALLRDDGTGVYRFCVEIKKCIYERVAPMPVDEQHLTQANHEPRLV